MRESEALEEALDLANRSTIAMLANNGEGGYPNVRAMIKVENEGLKSIWFATNTSSRKMARLTEDTKTCVYFVDLEDWKGLMLTGMVEIRQDPDSKRRLWQEGWERYYPLGVDDPDYTVLRFTAQWGRYYHALSHFEFDL